MAGISGNVEGDGLALTYTEWAATGNGPQLLLLHGIAGSSRDWTPVVEHLLDRSPGSVSRVVALDARGHGTSDWSDSARYDGDAHFADASLAMDRLAIRNAVVGGYSMGGGVAMMIAASRPECLAGLVVADAYPDPEMSAGSLSIARALARWWGEVEERAVSPRSGPWGGSGFDPAIAKTFAEDLSAGRARRLDLWPFWGAVACPTLLVRGALSSVVTSSVARLMLARQPNAGSVEIPGAGHALLAGSAPAVSGAIADFLAGLRQERTGAASDLADPKRPSNGQP